MRTFLAQQAQSAHFPRTFLVNGVMQDNPEHPDRIARLRQGAEAAGCRIEQPADSGMSAISAVHTPEYLQFLRHAHKRWSYIAGASESVTPNIHPSRRNGTYPASVVAQAGWHMSDASCPIGAETWDAAYWSAQAAIGAADAVLAGERHSYALCRPPGHHASAELAGGFCYLSNSAIAARRLQRQYPRVAVLDVDLHHGNGTQEIFYRDASVLTVSIHADPVRFYPFFWGSACERGEGDGLGFNYNLPLQRGSGDAEFLSALDQALDRTAAFAPDALVIALGLDAFEGDPFGGLAVTTPGYGKIGNAIAKRLPMPAVIVQEGGYLCDALGDNLSAFLSAFTAGHGG
ncbi:histone deacetylase family protein [Alteraurantiacibacter aestuarii]|uniref:Histone deacetylase family protein n=1 Tax=Alteraurantiacibacter aestuarii TaxID=650004 RepID=A0A844ZKQ3_9SPHN|nr:histone deacetylase family protein [Alteraurantiacibacter aestuarii]MXO88123.1 histone deacetylase family protein [Alteraurantiacibacter aestuarii]